MDSPLDLLRPTEAEQQEPQPVPKGGCIIAMEVNSGRILAAASAPTFDLGIYTSSTTTEWDAINTDHRRPLFSRITGMALPPGSVYKPLTAIAALETGTINAEQPFTCQGFLDNPDEHRCLIYRLYGSGHGQISLSQAISRSCNVYFFQAARDMGIAALVDWAGRFEFGQRTGIDLPFESPGNVIQIPGSTSAETLQRRYRQETLGMAIGQGRLTVTPLQMVRFHGNDCQRWLVGQSACCQRRRSRSYS